jgi:hypothetical protein
MLTIHLLKKCKEIGYCHPDTILSHRDDYSLHPRKFDHGGIPGLSYFQLSSSERTTADEIVMIEQGFRFIVNLSQGDYEAIQAMLDTDGHRFKKWSHLYHNRDEWLSRFYFTDETDAVVFRLLA